MKCCHTVVIAIVALLASMHLAAAAEIPQDARQASWGTLDQSLHDGGSDHRQQALAALATMAGSEEAIQRVESALDDKDPLVRQTAALALGEMKATSAAHRLEQALDDTPEVAFAAAKSLIEIGDEEGQPMLIGVLAGQRKDGPGMMTNAMRKAKSKLQHPEQLMLMGAQDATGAMFGPVAIAIPATKDAIDLRSKGTPGRAAAAAYLAKDPDPYAVTLLEWALGDDNEFVRVEAAKGLGQRGNANSIPKLEAALKDQHTMVRTMAAASILRILQRNGEPGTITSNPVQPIPTEKKK